MDIIDDHPHSFSVNEWPFSEPQNRAVLSTVQVFERGFPILLVSHDDDGDWQILCGTSNAVQDGIVVCLGCAFNHDRSIGELSDLPLGWVAWRESRDHPWQRESQGGGERGTDP